MKLETSPYHVFQIQIPGLNPVVIKIPKGLSDEDWTAMKKMVDIYLERYRKFEKESLEKNNENH